MDRLELALERAKAAAYDEGRKDGAARKPRIGGIFPVLRDEYARGFAETFRRARMGRPKTQDFGGKKTSAMMVDAAQPRAVTLPAVVLPADAVARRGVAGRESSRSTGAPAGVSS